MITAARSTVVGTPAGQQDLANLFAGLQVGAQLLSLGVQAAEIDDPADLAGTSRDGEVASIPAVKGLEVLARAQGVDEVVSHVHPA